MNKENIIANLLEEKEPWDDFSFTLIANSGSFEYYHCGSHQIEFKINTSREHIEKLIKELKDLIK